MSTIQDAFVQKLRKINDYGSIVHSRGTEQKELLFETSEISDITKLDINVHARKFNLNYALIEFLWYVSARRQVNNIGKCAKIWLDIADERGNVESNYGNYYFGSYQTESQFEWIVKELKHDKDSRRASVTIRQPYHNNSNPRDIPCSQSIQYLIRDNRLHCFVSMRSQDLIFGYCNDLVCYSLFQQLIFNELKETYPELKLGRLVNHSASLHIYERHYSMLENCMSELNSGNTLIEPRTSYRLKLTYKELKQQNLFLPVIDLQKEELYDWLSENMNNIFEITN